ncbi:hypothetical protein SALB1_0741 [Salinisphaera sp. LB1]|nr:hypothetical protein SALB1_0741 [Salinisphaera sp. LB1]
MPADPMAPNRRIRAYRPFDIGAQAAPRLTDTIRHRHRPLPVAKAD